MRGLGRPPLASIFRQFIVTRTARDARGGGCGGEREGMAVTSRASKSNRAIERWLQPGSGHRTRICVRCTCCNVCSARFERRSLTVHVIQAALAVVPPKDEYLGAHQRRSVPDARHRREAVGGRLGPERVLATRMQNEKIIEGAPAAHAAKDEQILAWKR